MEKKIKQDMKKRFEPGPLPGLSRQNFKKICPNGFGDPYNAYPHSMAWFKNRLYVGTTRANLCMLKKSQIQSNLKIWPTECPDDLYELDMRAQIWRYDLIADKWEMIFRSPMITLDDGRVIPRDLGYRGMTVFQGDSDPEPALYAATYASARGPGPVILRSIDGEEFLPVSRPGLVGLPITTIRLLTPFKGRLFTSPTGRAKGNPNAAYLPVIYESRDPAKGEWQPVNTSGFGDSMNLVIFEMTAFGDYLYAGTGNPSGYQVWRTRAEGNPPYDWEQVIGLGAYRGSLNMGVASFSEFKGALYIGSGIQNGGIDRIHKIGPAAPELIRVFPDGHWDLVVGQARHTPRGQKRPISGFFPGFNNFFNGYFWRMGVYEDWLYLGTFDWSLMMKYADQRRWPPWFKRIVSHIDLDNIIKNQSGFDFYRSFDGQNWLPVSTNGFDNCYNYGLRGLTPSPHGLFVGTVNPFAPKVAVKKGKKWIYEENKSGGLEIWLGKKSNDISR